jgi:exodeoxyribonuclease VII large subunit
LVAPDRTEVAVRLSVAAGTLLSAVQGQIDRGRVQSRHCGTRLERAAPNINMERQKSDDLTRSALAAVEQQLRRSERGLHGFQLALRSLDPYATLQRGYALVQRDGHVVDSVEGMSVGERLNVRVRDGDFPVRVDSGAPVPDQKRRRKAAIAKEQAPLFMMEV